MGVDIYMRWPGFHWLMHGEHAPECNASRGHVAGCEQGPTLDFRKWDQAYLRRGNSDRINALIFPEARQAYLDQPDRSDRWTYYPAEEIRRRITIVNNTVGIHDGDSFSQWSAFADFAEKMEKKHGRIEIMVAW